MKISDTIHDLAPNRVTNPYYIVAPPYSRKSAGVRSLHLLCHWLNRSGYPAFLHILGPRKPRQFHPDLVTPELNQLIADDHFIEKRTPIVIYPETVRGNPLQANCVVRYLLNYPGLLGGDTTYDAKEMIFGYTEKLAQSVDHPSGILFMPLVDRSIFNPGAGTVRRGSCFYAAKYRAAGHHVFGLPADAVEIYRDGAHAQSPAEIAELFRSCEKFYIFEDTALSLEAALCGCPTVAMRSDFFSAPLLLSEFKAAGFALDDGPDEFSRAIESLDKLAEIYDAHISSFWQQLEGFISATQARSFADPTAENRLKIPDYRLGWRKTLLRRMRRRFPNRTWLRLKT